MNDNKKEDAPTTFSATRKVDKMQNEDRGGNWRRGTGRGENRFDEGHRETKFSRVL